jgi:hypothetical protein
MAVCCPMQSIPGHDPLRTVTLPESCHSHEGKRTVGSSSLLFPYQLGSLYGVVEYLDAE